MAAQHALTISLTAALCRSGPGAGSPPTLDFADGSVAWLGLSTHPPTTWLTATLRGSGPGMFFQAGGVEWDLVRPQG